MFLPAGRIFLRADGAGAQPGERRGLEGESRAMGPFT